MLHSQTVAPATLALLKAICKEPLLKAFALGGGCLLYTSDAADE